MSKKKRVLATRALPKEQERRLKNAQIELTTVNFIETRWLKNYDLPELQPNHTILFSSQNAIQSTLNMGLKNFIAGHTVLCVGQKTASLLLKHNIKAEQHFETATDMAEYAVKLNKPTVFFTGNLRMRAIEDAFENNPSQLEVIEVYRTQLNTVDLSEEFDVVLFLSPSAVEGYFFYNDIGGAQAVCIGKTTSATAKNYTQHVHMASRNAIEAVVDKAIELAS